jgi:YVTN family beta-propeller protein
VEFAPRGGRSPKVVGTVAVGSGPEAVAVSPDGRRAYVANMGSDSVSVIDTRAAATIGTPIAVGDEPDGVAVSPDGTRAYVTNRSGNSISVIGHRGPSSRR